MSRERIAGIASFALIGAILALAIVQVSQRWNEIRPKTEGDPAPEFALPKIGPDGKIGDVFELAAMKGKVVMLDFWATWCGPCRASMPRIEAIARSFAGRDVEFVSINTEGRRKAKDARTMAERLNPSSLLLLDGGQVADVYGATTIPHMVVISKTGRIEWVHRGGLTAGAGDKLTKVIEGLLK